MFFDDTKKRRTVLFCVVPNRKAFAFFERVWYNNYANTVRP